MNTIPEPTFLTASDVGQLFGISETDAQDLFRNRVLRSFQRDGAMMTRVVDLAKYMYPTLDESDIPL